MNIVIFSGTTEGRKLSRELADSGAEVLVCVATEYGKVDQGICSGVQVHAGRLNEEEMTRLLARQDLCIDATHPYATQVTANLQMAAKQTGTPYKRLLRPASMLPEDCVTVQDADDAVRWLSGTQGNILLTTGAKELATFAALGSQRLYARVLPLYSGLAACKEAGIPPAHIVAMQGPFGVELNKALLRQFSVRYLVTKDGGAAGGFAEKYEAARACDVGVVVLCRPAEEGESYKDVLNFCKEWMAECR